MIKLSEIIEALEDVDIDMTAYFNTKTNKILWKNSIEPEYSTYKEEDEFNAELIFMFDFTSKNDYDIMLQFIYEIDNIELKMLLISKVNGHGAFKRFRIAIDTYSLTEKWYKFRDEKYKEIAIHWCENNHIKYEKDC